MTCGTIPIVSVLLALFSVSCSVPAQQSAPNIEAVRRSFLAPPDDTRVLMRWWWFGPAVVHPELEREMQAMKAGGIGGFEIQPVYPMALDDASTGFRNLPYLSPGFLDALHFTAGKAHDLGLRVDLTLASGWPYGGPHVPIDEAAGRLRVVPEELPPNAASLPLPAMGNGESLLAVFAGPGTAKLYDPVSLKQLPLAAASGRYALPPTAEPRVVVFYTASHTGQQVKRAAVGAEGFVLDHFSRPAIDHHLALVADPLIAAFGATPPYSVFSDSLEVYGSDWTADLLPEFARRRGYDLTSHLPELASGSSPASAALRHDWGKTLTELIDERYLTPIDDWAKAHGTRFRSQTYGEPAVSLSSNRLVALPEGEGPQWRAFSYTRLASSASHLYGRPVTSAETWTWLHSPAFRATPLDMKAEADRFFLQGVNQLIGHGWPYTPPGVPEPGWAFYAAAVFNDHNPWWPVMPDVTRYLQRVSYLLRQGKPANDIAVLLPNDDVYAEFKPGEVALSNGLPKRITPALVTQILDSGYNFDFIDTEAVAQVGIPYPVLVLPHVDRMSPATLKTIAAYAQRGGKVIAIGSIPTHAPGFLHAEEIAAEVQSLAKTLFNATHAILIPNEAALGPALQQALPPDVCFHGPSADIGFLHRKLPAADLYFVVNSNNRHVHTSAKFRTARTYASSWDPFSGKLSAFNAAPEVTLDLAPYESRVLVFSDAALSGTTMSPPANSTQLADLTNGWTVTFPALPLLQAQHKSTTGDWTANPQTRFFSGEAVYTRALTLTAADLHGSPSLLLDFGPGTPVEANPAIKSGMRALLESPIREAATVRVNGEAAGSVWHPPYQLDLAPHLHEGANRIEIHVYNLAINQLAGRAPADFRLLSARYGQRFVPQDMDHLEPLPSGILGPVHLLRMETR